MKRLICKLFSHKCEHDYKLARFKNSSMFLPESEDRELKCTKCNKRMPFSVHTLYSISSENYHHSDMNKKVREFYNKNNYNAYIN